MAHDQASLRIQEGVSNGTSLLCSLDSRPPMVRAAAAAGSSYECLIPKEKPPHREVGRLRGERCYSAAIFGVAASIAADRRGGDSGRSVMRMFIERDTALPTAASGGTIGTSPTPRTP